MAEKKSTIESLLRRSERNLIAIVFTTAWSGSSALVLQQLAYAQDVFSNFRLEVVDLEGNPELADAFGVYQASWVLLLKDREVVEILRGVTSKAKLYAKISEHGGENA